MFVFSLTVIVIRMKITLENIILSLKHYTYIIICISSYYPSLQYILVCTAGRTKAWISGRLRVLVNNDYVSSLTK